MVYRTKPSVPSQQSNVNISTSAGLDLSYDHLHDNHSFYLQRSEQHTCRLTSEKVKSEDILLLSSKSIKRRTLTLSDFVKKLSHLQRSPLWGHLSLQGIESLNATNSLEPGGSSHWPTQMQQVWCAPTMGRQCIQNEGKGLVSGTLYRVGHHTLFWNSWVKSLASPAFFFMKTHWLLWKLEHFHLLFMIVSISYKYTTCVYVIFN